MFLELQFAFLLLAAVIAVSSAQYVVGGYGYGAYPAYSGVAYTGGYAAYPGYAGVAYYKK